jgi:hypothetical protein
VAARVPDPRVCTVCGGAAFEVVEPEVLDRIAAAEGGFEEETTYDGRKLVWTQEAKKALRAIDDRYQRRRAKARIEKAAHGRRAGTITLDLANRYIEEETGVLYKPAGAGAAADPAAAAALLAEARAAADALHAAGGGRPAAAADCGAEPRGAGAGGAADDDPELKILARDEKGNPLVSRFAWTADALPRIFRVPAGFMRDKTQRRIEELAAERGVAAIDLALVEEGIEHGKRMMAEMLGQVAAAPAQPAEGDCPVEHEPARRPSGPALNEVGLMGEIERRRLEPAADDGA